MTILKTVGHRKFAALCFCVLLVAVPEYIGSGISENAAEAITWMLGIFCGGNGIEHVSKAITQKSGETNAPNS